MMQFTPGRPTTSDMVFTEETKQLKSQYCYCVDHKDWAQLSSLINPDSLFDEHKFAIANYLA